MAIEFKPMSIKEWIESDFARSLESEEDYKKWSLFEIIPSDKAYEQYPLAASDPRSNIDLDGNPIVTRVENTVYSIGMIGLNEDVLKKEMGKVLIALRDSAMAIKPEGHTVGEGILIIQDRLNIFLSKDNDFDKTCWTCLDMPRDQRPEEGCEDCTGGQWPLREKSGRYKIMWYGAMTRIDKDCSLTPITPS